jgi:uncharacterized membrane protein YeiH
VNQGSGLVFAVELVAVLAAAFSGFAESQRKQMDVVGVFTVAFITAFGGGTLRDVLLDRRPFFWVEHQSYVILIFALSLLAAPLMRHAQRIIPNAGFIAADAIGLGFFSIAGVSLALAAGMPTFTALMMGVITGVFGGVLRDVVLNEVPIVLRDNRPYAMTAFFGCGFYVLMRNAGADEALALWTSAALITVTRLIAWRYDWSLK